MDNEEFNLASDVVLIATGGQKSVFKANHPKWGSVVLKEGSFNSISALERIRREIIALKDIDSPYYPKHHYFNVDLLKSKFYIIEEYVVGETLSASKKIFSDEKKVLTLFKSIVEALNILWSKKIVHRDIKPDNIIIKPDLTPCILDLGIAKFMDQQSLTNTIFSMGPCTPIYAAPEQLINNKDSIDVRADFFALGIIITELLGGFHPYDPSKIGNSSSIPENILSSTYLLPNNIDPNLAKLLKNILMRQPFQRLRTPKDLQNALSKII